MISVYTQHRKSLTMQWLELLGKEGDVAFPTMTLFLEKDL